VGWKNITVFADSLAKVEVTIDSQMTVNTGKKIFGKCEKLAQKTIGVSVPAAGANGLGVNTCRPRTMPR
jgi:hypothetical protein